MRRTPVALFALVVSLVVVACSTNDSTTSPPRGVAPAPSRALLSLTCSNAVFSTMTQDAKAYFPAKDQVFDSIANMKKLFGTSLAAATPTGFHILSRTADVRNGGSQIGSAAAGGKFVLDVVGCMSVGSVDDTFKPDQALDKGVFEVKGNANADAALAKVASAGHAALNASPLWGAEPNGVWTRTGQAQYLVYGYPLGASVTTSGFEMGTIPQSVSRAGIAGGLANLFRVGLCIQPASGASANRLIHAGAIVTGLLDPASNVDQGASFCAGHLSSSVTNTTWLQRLASGALAVISPSRLFAQFDGGLGIGGLPDGWSPIVPNSIPGASITLSFGGPISNTFADSLFTVVITAKDGSNHPVPGVAVAITVDNNSGVPAGAKVVGDSTATTRANGEASFLLGVGKAGGFILAANGTLSGVPTQSKLSNQFQVQNK